MVYFRVDDIIVFHPRFLEAGDAATGLWARAGAWCQQHLTDGRIPKTIARSIAEKPTVTIPALLRVGLWTEDGDEYVFHAWGAGVRQTSRAQVLAKRDADRVRIAGKRGQEKTPVARESHASRVGLTDDVATIHSTPLHSTEKDMSDESDAPPPRKANAKPEDDPAFMAIWNLYGLKQSRPTAFNAWRKALTKTTPDVIEAGIRRYLAFLDATPDRPQKMLATFLNQESWTDEFTSRRLANPIDPQDEWRYR